MIHRQWKSDHYSSHYLGPRGVVPETGTDVEEVLRIASPNCSLRCPRIKF